MLSINHYQGPSFLHMYNKITITHVTTPCWHTQNPITMLPHLVHFLEALLLEKMRSYAKRKLPMFCICDLTHSACMMFFLDVNMEGASLLDTPLWVYMLKETYACYIKGSSPLKTNTWIHILHICSWFWFWTTNINCLLGLELT